MVDGVVRASSVAAGGAKNGDVHLLDAVCRPQLRRYIQGGPKNRTVFRSS